MFLSWGQSASRPSHIPRQVASLQLGSFPTVSAALDGLSMLSATKVMNVPLRDCLNHCLLSVGDLFMDSPSAIRIIQATVIVFERRLRYMTRDYDRCTRDSNWCKP